MKRTIVLSFAFAALILGGCASTNARLMPSNTTTTASLCGSYEEAKAVYDSLERYKTTLADLKKTCFSPSQPNINRLSARQIQQMFLPSQAAKFENLPKGIQECLQNFELCWGFESPLKDLKDRGVGAFIKRVLKCEKNNLVKGPDASFIFYLQGGLLVFMEEFGKADVAIISQEKKPLCILQEPAEVIMKYTPTP